MNVISLHPRVEEIHVKRSAISVAAENAQAANQNARDALDRAAQHIWSGNRAAAIHALGRIGFEVQARTDALMALTNLSEQAAVCPDGIADINHGNAA